MSVQAEGSPAGVDLEVRVRRIELILVRLATAAPDALPDDAHALVADIVATMDGRTDE